MKKPVLVKNLLSFAGILFFLVCLTSCNKKDYNLLDPESAGVWTYFKAGTAGLPNAHIWDIERDSDNLWVSFMGSGVGVYNNGSWIYYNSSNSGILNDYIYDLELTPAGDMLMGTGDGICERTASGQWLSYQDPSVTLMQVQVVKYTSTGDIWLGTEGAGFYVDFGSGFNHYKYTGYENVNAIEEDNKGNVWVGTDNGLLKYDGISLNLAYTTDDGLPGNKVSTLFFDSNNKLWVGTDGTETVSWITTSGNIHQLSLRNGGANYIMDIYEDRKGDLWFATWVDGVIKYDGVLPYSFKEYNGFYENYVNCIREDNKGNIWFGLWSKGLVKYTLPIDKN